ncbi:MAG TPA: hypothetical protein VLF39_04195 [Candidatus Saccharimonadales bacterium]|nr:hypothetical protein [Candidatus Saccharimonadales bacterium]
MAGLGLGSISTSRIKNFINSKVSIDTLRLYAIAELFIGLGSIIVPKLFIFGNRSLLAIGQTSSFWYLVLTAIMVFISILPWSFTMGTTIPLMMSVFKERRLSDTRSFSLLYTVNSAGALFGVVVSTFVLIELFGFQATLLMAGILNVLIALLCFYLARQLPKSKTRRALISSNSMTAKSHINKSNENQLPLYVLFFTGFCSIGLEVIWTRLFTAVLLTTVYAFALILIVYLLATVAGVRTYRRKNRQKPPVSTTLLVWLVAIVSISQIEINDPRLHLGAFGLVVTIFVYAFLLGYLTPKQVDQYSLGNPKIAGRAYSINALGCIIGPLLVGYLLLPWLGARTSIIILSAPFLVIGSILLAKNKVKYYYRVAAVGSSVALIMIGLLINVSYEEGPLNIPKMIKRDYSATVFAYGSGLSKQLMVNGNAITSLSPITKIMAHLPLATHSTKVSNVLVICFGMGTTFRSSLSWGVDTTSVELTPSVPELFPYFFGDANKVISDKHGKIVIDDGRRYLQRVNKQYDLITIDPPPPSPTVGSSLLYSREFYKVAKSRLARNGILQQWYPGVAGETLQAVARSLADEFTYVKVYRSTIEPYVSERKGYHFLASMEPLIDQSPIELAKKMPASAQKDLLEWESPGISTEKMLKDILNNEVNINSLLNPDKSIVITDDHPFNEYFYLRYSLRNKY